MDEASANELANKIDQILESESNDLLELAQLAGLNPLKDFKASDLRDVNFSGANLEGVDLRGCLKRGQMRKKAHSV
jgi:uncharacterized protein YjbI with pentapeptide repeats